MQDRIKRLLTIFFVVLICFGITTIATSEDLSQLVPPETIVYFQFPNPDQFFQGIDDIYQRTGLAEELDDIQSIYEFTLRELQDEMGVDDLSWLDRSHPMGITLFQSDEKLTEERPYVALFLPLLNSTQFFDMVERQRDQVALFEAFPVRERFGNYVGMLSSPEAQSLIPPISPYNMGTLQGYPSDSFQISLHLPRLLKSAHVDIKERIEHLESGILDDGYAMQTRFRNLNHMIQIELLKLIDEIKWIQSAGSLNATGGRIFADIDYKQEGWVTRFGQHIQTNSDITSFLKYLPDDFLFSTITNLDPESMRDLISDYMFYILGSLTTSEEQQRAIKELTDRYFQTLGTRTAMALGMDIDFDSLFAMMNGGGGNVLAQMGQINQFIDQFFINMVMVQEVRNEASYKQMLRTLLTHPALIGSLNALLADLGVKFELQYQENQRTQGFVHDAITISITEFAPTDNVMINAMILDIVNRILEKLTIYVHYRESKAFMTMGKDALTTLKGLVTNQRYPSHPMNESYGIQPFLREMPADANLFTQFSILGLIKILNSMPQNTSPFNSVQIPSNMRIPGMVGYANILDQRWSCSGYMNADEFVLFIKAIKDLLLRELR
jgi:hypothetical protein